MKKLFAMLLALCLMCGVMIAVAEGVQEVAIGRATFQIPVEFVNKELVIMESDVSGLVAKSEVWDFSITAVDWASHGFDLGNRPQWMNVYNVLNLFYQNSELASKLADEHTEEDIGMPDKQAVAHLVFDQETGAVLTLGHAYDGYGFMFLLTGPTGADQQAMLDMCKEIALSFRLDGMTAEEMTAAAEEATRIAAQQAATQKYIVITNGTANIRAKADSKSSKITTAKKGDTFSLIGEEGNWYKIEVNGQTAYVSKGLCEIKE